MSRLHERQSDYYKALALHLLANRRVVGRLPKWQVFTGHFPDTLIIDLGRSAVHSNATEYIIESWLPPRYTFEGYEAKYGRAPTHFNELTLLVETSQPLQTGPDGGYRLLCWLEIK